MLCPIGVVRQTMLFSATMTDEVRDRVAAVAVLWPCLWPYLWPWMWPGLWLGLWPWMWPWM